MPQQAYFKLPWEAKRDEGGCREVPRKFKFKLDGTMPGGDSKVVYCPRSSLQHEVSLAQTVFDLIEIDRLLSPTSRHSRFQAKKDTSIE